MAGGEGGAARPVRPVVEGLDAAEPGIGMPPERRQDRRETVAALAGGAAVAVVQVDMREQPRGQPAVEQCHHRLGLAIPGGGDIQHGAQRRIADALHNGHGFRHRARPIRLARRQRLQAIHEAGIGGPFAGPGQGRLGPPGIALRLQPPLGGRAMHQQPRPEIGGEPDQPLHHIERPGAPRRIGGGDGKPLGRHQQPVQAGDADAGLGGGAAERDARASRQQMRRRRIQGEGREFQPGIAEARGPFALLREGQAPHHLIAQRQAHPAVSGTGRQAARNRGRRPAGRVARRGGSAEDQPQDLHHRHHHQQQQDDPPEGLVRRHGGILGQDGFRLKRSCPADPCHAPWLHARNTIRPHAAPQPHPQGPCPWG
jgi:hypothetical protein